MKATQRRLSPTEREYQSIYLGVATVIARCGHLYEVSAVKDTLTVFDVHVIFDSLCSFIG